MTEDAGELLRRAMAQAGLFDIGRTLPKPSWGRSCKLEVGADGTLRAAGHAARVGVGLDSAFPTTLPKVFVLDRQLRRLPHVAPDGRLCAFEDENTLLDHRDGEGIIAAVLLRAKRVLEDGLLGVSEHRNPREFGEGKRARVSVNA